MKRFIIAVFVVLAGSFLALAQKPAAGNFKMKIAKLQYDGGGDWYANPSSLPNLIEFISQNTTIQLDK